MWGVDLGDDFKLKTLSCGFIGITEREGEVSD
jgi:hypothetical protein